MGCSEKLDIERCERAMRNISVSGLPEEAIGAICDRYCDRVDEQPVAVSTAPKKRECWRCRHWRGIEAAAGECLVHANDVTMADYGCPDWEVGVSSNQS